MTKQNLKLSSIQDKLEEIAKKAQERRSTSKKKLLKQIHNQTDDEESEVSDGEVFEYRGFISALLLQQIQDNHHFQYEIIGEENSPFVSFAG